MTANEEKVTFSIQARGVLEKEITPLNTIMHPKRHLRTLVVATKRRALHCAVLSVLHVDSLLLGNHDCAVFDNNSQYRHLKDLNSLMQKR